MLVLCEPPLKSSSHSVSQRFADAIEREGIRCKFLKIGPEYPIKWLRQHRVPRAHAIYYLMFGWMVRRKLSKLKQDDIAWVYSNQTVINPFNSLFCNNIIQGKCAKHVFVLMDGWLHNPHQRHLASALISAADMTAAITPQLLDDVKEFDSSVMADLFEEAIDTNIVKPVDISGKNYSVPRIVWTGSAENLRHLLASCADPLAEVFCRAPFVLRIIGASGAKTPPQVFPVEKLPYDISTEGELLSAGIVGLNWAEETEYAAKKGFYKVKSYMAAGLPTVTNSVGYLKEMITDGVTGRFVNDSATLVDILTWLLRKPVKAKFMGENARVAAVKKFSYESLARKYIDVLARHFPNEIDLAAQQKDSMLN